ncbi:Carboxy-terminal processing protease CtpA precursor [Polystyrenella longa]|uniref:Carboxy-terminal processing protease CtpA n=2 Tax=Polystyrenella longa TaxID=2528007 RepID=A0A518CS46_9PLAN|nr:Carboxy-terminal processing protease CtpA precursor [Polystyrenella longa]
MRTACATIRFDKKRILHSCALFMLFVIILIASSAFLLADDETEKSDEERYYELMSLFVDTFEKIEKNYVDEIDRREMVEAAVRGMLRELDPYSNYISRNDIQRFNQTVDQEFGGIGIQVFVDPDTTRLTVMTPIPGTPAYAAGVKAGDTILEIEGKSTDGFQVSDAVELLKGKRGEKVKLKILHNNEADPIDLEIERDVIKLSTVLGMKYNDDATWNFWLNDEEKIAYIRLTHFSRRSSEELQTVLDELVLKGMRGLILDLRSNPGGLLSQATDISDMFIESGRIVSTKGRNTPERVWDARSEGTYKGFPMAVLVNRFSASASEIVAACLQDHDRAVVIGERTWGKGSVQNVFDLEAGNSALKLTTASYHRPSGKNIHRSRNAKTTDDWGVMPNEEYTIDFSNDELRAYLEFRRKLDVIGAVEEEDPFDDTQLNKAMEYVESKLKPEKEKETE